MSQQPPSSCINRLNLSRVPREALIAICDFILSFSDDVDVMDTSKELDNQPVFNEWDLQINKSRTEFVNFRIAGKEDGTPLRAGALVSS